MTGASIQRLSRLDELPVGLRGGVVAIGNFDGVHRGHQAVLTRALAEADKQGRPALVLTFEPHPRAVFTPDRPPFRITPASMKARFLGLLGFDAVVEHPFTREFSRLAAAEFVEQVLVDGMNAHHVVTGFDFHFGRDRHGDPGYLREAGSREGFEVTLVEALSDENAEVISSSRVRDLLKVGEVAEAAGLLGYRFTVEAPVTPGKRLGRELGFPTANMALSAETELRHGIYAVRFRAGDGSLHDGVASFGRRPTVDEDGAPLLETYLFDFAGDLYGQTCSVSFFGFLRGEERFDSLDALVAQIKRDEAEARALLSGVRPLGELDARVAF